MTTGFGKNCRFNNLPVFAHKSFITALKAISCLIVLIITATQPVRSVLTFITGELLASFCFSWKAGVSLHQKGWQLRCHLFLVLAYTYFLHRFLMFEHISMNIFI